MFDIFYTIIIYPLVQIIELFYMLFHKVFGEVSISILGVSIGVTLLCLPLYIVAEKWQKIEQDTQKRLASKVRKIKDVFKSDEQYMILQTYYRQNHYHPIYALRNSFGILVQIPFFIAAYIYISHQPELNGQSFFLIKDLSSPDALLNIGAFGINILPILMTLINLISGAVYTKGLAVKDKLQIYGTALVFLFLLYNSPSGLVLYWTMNNIFSLIKNIFYKLKNPAKILYILSSLIAVIFIIYLLFINNGDFRKRIVLAAVFIFIPLIPFLIRLLRRILDWSFISLQIDEKQRNILFLLSCVSITVLAGLYIPGTVIASSPEEFSFIDAYKTPFPFISESFLQAAGLCMFWTACIYFLFNNTIKTIIAFLCSFGFFTMLINALIFQGDYGMISNTFLFDTPNILIPPLIFTIINIAATIGLLVIFFLLLKIKKITAIISATGIIFAALSAASLYNGYRIYSGYNKLFLIQDTTAVHSVTPVFSLAKNKPNVVVIMADRAIGGFVKPIFDEHPALLRQYDGFTWYPNTVSFAAHTLMGVPPVWGGYEYTPEEINNRNTVPLVEKHNEALLVLPRLLSDNGFAVTVTDPSWANYSWIPDNSIYKAYKNIKAFNTMGQYTNLWYIRNNMGESGNASIRIKRNILWFSLLKTVPPALRFFVYDGGMYWALDDISGSMVNFINSYSVLDFLPELTDYNADEPSALLITNETTHTLLTLQYPDYIPVEKVTQTRTEGGEFAGDKNYHVNNAFFLMFGKWLEELQKHGVYDNTRIVIVSDHGWHINTPFDTDAFSVDSSYEPYHCVLLVKDFNSHGEPKTDMTFMTNADVPVLAASGIIENLINPFTGTVLSNFTKENGVDITSNRIVMSYQHPKNTFKIDSDEWLHVHDNIFNPNNWKKIKK